MLGGSEHELKVSEPLWALLYDSYNGGAPLFVRNLP